MDGASWKMMKNRDEHEMNTSRYDAEESMLHKAKHYYLSKIDVTYLSGRCRRNRGQSWN